MAKLPPRRCPNSLWSVHHLPTDQILAVAWRVFSMPRGSFGRRREHFMRKCASCTIGCLPSHGAGEWGTPLGHGGIAAYHGFPSADDAQDPALMAKSKRRLGHIFVALLQLITTRMPAGRHPELGHGDRRVLWQWAGHVARPADPERGPPQPGPQPLGRKEVGRAPCRPPSARARACLGRSRHKTAKNGQTCRDEFHCTRAAMTHRWIAIRAHPAPHAPAPV